MKPTRVVHLKRKGGQVVQGCDVYIGRRCKMGGWNLEESPWANPYGATPYRTREDVIELYRQYIMNKPDLLARVGELKGKTLGCWCKPLGCHGDVLVELAEKH